MKKLGLLLTLLVLAGLAGAQTTIFSDNMTNFPSGWTLSPTTGWVKSSTRYYSASYSARCDDVSPYGNSQNNYMTRSVSLSGYSSATLKFYIWQYTESGYDYVYVQYYSGSTWTTAWSRAGNYQSWSQQSVTIPVTATQVRFWFKSDASVTYTGAYVDDVVLTATSTATPTLAVSMTSWAPAAAGGTSSAVSVTNSATTSVIAYTVASNQAWLTVSSASGSTPGSFTMTAAANTTTSSRTATVTVTATTSGVLGSPKTIAVTQAAGSSTQNDAGSGGDAGNTFAAALQVNPGSWTGCYLSSTDTTDYYKFSVTAGQVIKVKITPPSGVDFDLKLYNPSQAQKASSTAGAGYADSCVYTADATGYWYAKAYYYSGTSGYYGLSISVSGTVTPTLAVSMTSWAPAAAGGTSSAVSVTNSATTSVIAYTVASNQAWLTVSSASGSTPGSFTMTAAANTTTSSRTATVTVTATTSGVLGSPKTIAVTQAGTSSGSAEWTIMVYLNADNNLEDDGINDFLEMAAASYSSGKVNVIVQMDRSSSYNTTYGNWTTCKRFKIANGMTPEATYQLSDLGEVDMGNPTTLSTFAVWAIQNYPANRYSLIMWDHGSGWYKGTALFKDFSNDDQSGNSIGIANGEFAGAMATIKSALGRNLDHIGWDACLMGMWEVLDISRNYANAANVSEETESAAGWYYTTWLNNLNTTPTMSAIDMGKAIINGTSQSTLSVVDLTQVAALNTAVSTFADELMAARAAGLSSSLSTALTNTLKFSPSYFSYHIDLSDFATKVKAAITTRPPLTAACDNVISAVSTAVKLYKNSSSYANARGIAIFHNSSSSNYNTSYNSLPVAASTHWDEYLKGQTSATSGGTAGGSTNTRFGRDHAPAFELAPCLPNPVRGSAILSFQLLDPAPTTLHIYNLNGQLVKTLVDGYCGTGWHDCQWDLNDNAGKRVSAGTYLFKLESGTLHDMKRLVVVK